MCCDTRKIHARFEIILHKNNVEFFENFMPELKLFYIKIPPYTAAQRNGMTLENGVYR